MNDPHKTDRDMKGRTAAQARKLAEMDAADTVVNFMWNPEEEAFGPESEEDGL